MAGKSKGRGGRGGKSKNPKSNNSRGTATSSTASGASSINKNVSAPTGNSLTLELIGSPATFDLTKTESFPATTAVNSSEVEGNKLSLHLPSWDALDAIIAWFRDASDADHEASLSFSSALAKQHRAKIHSAASAIGLGALVSLSRGVGEDRRITIARRGSTVAKAAAAAAAIEDPVLAAKAALLYSWALKDHVEVSRDESVEIMANNGGDNMPEALAIVWAAHWPRQEAAERLCMAISKNDLAEVQSAIEAAPKGAIASGSIVDEHTGVAPLHLAAGEGHVALVEVLLSAGFPVNCKDGAGATALDIARKYEHSDVQGVLIRAGAVDTEVVPTISESANSTAAPIANGGHPLVTDSVVSVCGTDASTDKAAEISSVVGDFVDSEYSENGTTAPPPTTVAVTATTAGTAADCAVTQMGLSEKGSGGFASKSEETSSKKTSSKHGKFAVSVPAAVVEATAAVAAKAEDFVAYGKKALSDSKAASTKAIENTRTATLSYGHKAIDGGKAAVESSKAYTVKALESGKSVVTNAAEKADENVKVAVSWVKAHYVYILAGAGAVVATAGVALAMKHRNNMTSRY
ncbi:putative GA-binding protein subunit beta-1 [Nannochloris sp. 'desiccata']|nr:hypothetical protein KSW81_005496 [Chlorella desiccata (nom. nud.)]KAH7621294.1 putative GA-binding protein subunit beta-1 [Chlorella desiccata (nom. nud.)]